MPDWTPKKAATGALRVVYVLLDEARRWDRNPKLHDIPALSASIQRHGFRDPPIYDAALGAIVAGNGRVEALTQLRDLGAEVPPGVAVDGKGRWCLPVLVGVDAESRKQAESFGIDHNALTLAGAGIAPEIVAQLFDGEAMRAILAEMDVAPVSMEREMMAAESWVNGHTRQAPTVGAGDPPEPREDEAAALAVKWGTALGQAWEVPSQATTGQAHRLRCGDSADAATVGDLLAGLSIRMLETDPPYGIDYSKLKDGIPGSGFAQHTEKHGHIESDDLTDGPALQAFLERMIRAALPFMAKDAAYYFWHPMLTQGTFFAAAAAAADILIHRQIIWVKRGFVLTRSGMYHWRHELCFYGWVRGSRPPWFGDKSQTSVWEGFGRDDDHGMHPTQKPIELFLRPMRNHVLPGEWVYEPFLGSGSQVIAAERHGCLCAGMEISPKFLAVTLQRLADMGLEPRLIGS